MARESGFAVTVKAFIPAPKTDFKKQSELFSAMADLEKTKTIPADLLEQMQISEVSVKQTTRDATATATDTTSG